MKLMMLDKIENLYLSILRVIILIIATFLAFLVAYYAVSGAYKSVRYYGFVTEKSANVSEAELVSSVEKITNSNTKTTPRQNVSSGKAEIDPMKVAIEAHAERMYLIWSHKYEIFRKSEAEKLSKDEFMEWYIKGYLEVKQKQHQLPTWYNNISLAEKDLRSLEGLIEKVSTNQVIVGRMNNFRTDKSNDIKDQFDQLFLELNNAYWNNLSEETQNNAMQAEAERNRLSQMKEEGTFELTRALFGFGIFGAIMFSFLIIAIERHQRKISAQLEILKINTSKVIGNSNEIS